MSQRTLLEHNTCPHIFGNVSARQLLLVDPLEEWTERDSVDCLCRHFRSETLTLAHSALRGMRASNTLALIGHLAFGGKECSMTFE